MKKSVAVVIVLLLFAGPSVWGKSSSSTIALMPTFDQVSGQFNLQVYNEEKVKGFSDNKAWVKMTERVFEKIKDGLYFNKELVGNIYVVKNPSINAKSSVHDVYICEGLLNFIDNEAQLAGVIGHEIGHISNQDISHNYGQIAMQHNIIANATRAAGPGYESNVRLVDKIMPVAVSIFTKDQEFSADLSGLGYATSAGYKAEDVISFYEKLEKKMGSTHGVVAWLAHHPPLDKRIARLKESLQKRPETQQVKLEYLRIDPTPFLPAFQGKEIPGYTYVMIGKKKLFCILSPSQRSIRQNNSLIKKGSVIIKKGVEKIIIACLNIDPGKWMIGFVSSSPGRRATINPKGDYNKKIYAIEIPVKEVAGDNVTVSARYGDTDKLDDSSPNRMAEAFSKHARIEMKNLRFRVED